MGFGMDFRSVSEGIIGEMNRGFYTGVGIGGGLNTGYTLIQGEGTMF